MSDYRARPRLRPDIEWGGPDLGLSPEREERHRQAAAAMARPARRPDPIDQLIASLDDLAELEAYGRAIGMPIAGVEHEPGWP